MCINGDTCLHICGNIRLWVYTGIGLCIYEMYVCV